MPECLCGCGNVVINKYVDAGHASRHYASLRRKAEQDAGARSCRRCKVLKPLDDFPVDPQRPGSLYSYCKDCKAAYMRDHSARNRPRARLVNYKSKLPKRYGITWDDYQALLAAQKGVCAICGNPPENDRLLSVDHCHTRGTVRALLCHPCNMGLGCFKDDPHLVLRARRYLLRFSAED